MYEKCKSYLEQYNRLIAPRLEELDLLVKERRSPIAVWEAAQLLDLPPVEIECILEGSRLGCLDYKSIFVLVMQGSSEICRLIQRESKSASPTYYRPQDLSFIYGLDIKKVERAFAKLGISETASRGLPAVFDIIPAKV